MKKQLTERQREIYDFIVEEVHQRGLPPTIKEIGDRFGMRSPNGAREALNTLARKGYIRRHDRSSRHIELVEPTNSTPEKEYRVFISHAWNDTEDYSMLEKMLSTAQGFNFKNYSVPSDSPLPGADWRVELRRRLAETSVVVLLAGPNAPSSKALRDEIELASELGKPIVAVMTPENTRIPDDVNPFVRDVVGWNRSSIVAAIRRHAR